MWLRARHPIGALFALAVLTAVVAMQRTEPPAHTFHVTLGFKDIQPTDWSGYVSVEGCTVTGLSGWRFEGKDAVQGTAAWKAWTKAYIASEGRYPLTPATGKAAKPPQKIWPLGVSYRLTSCERQGGAQRRTGQDCDSLRLGRPETGTGQQGQLLCPRAPEGRTKRARPSGSRGVE
jgi:hypothetical protein